MTELIAGHTFEETPKGRRCTALDHTGKTCFVSWLAIRDADKSDLEKPGFAHVGNLDARELDSIVKERLREEAALWEAVHFAASAGSR